MSVRGQVEINGNIYRPDVILEDKKGNLIFVEFKHLQGKGTNINQDHSKLKDYGDCIGMQKNVVHGGNQKKLKASIYIFSLKEAFLTNRQAIEKKSERRVAPYYIDFKNNNFVLKQ